MRFKTKCKLILYNRNDVFYRLPLLLIVAVFLGYNQYRPGGFRVLWGFFCPGALERSQAVVLVLMRLRKRGQGLKSHPTDCEKPVVEPVTPGLQDIGLSPTPRLSLLLIDRMLIYGVSRLTDRSTCSISK